MSEKIFKIENMTKSIDDLLKVTENPRHREMLVNYRRHAMLEVAGRWKEILQPDMIVSHPVYRIYENGQYIHLDGMKDVENFYQSIAEQESTVFGAIEEEVYLSDKGIAMESFFGGSQLGSLLISQGVDVDDPDAYYNVTRWISSFWPYDENGRLMGEHIYENYGSREITKLDPEHIITPEEAREYLNPIIDNDPEWVKHPIA